MFSVGVDLIRVDRIEKSMANKRFMEKVFSPEEINLFEHKRYNPETAAANFCAKEAFSKAVKTGVRGFSLNEVSILRNDMGAPFIVLSGKAAALFGDMQFDVSLSHSDGFAMAAVLAFRS